MADLTVTAASVLASSNATKRKGIAGATITAGQVLYEDSADGKFKLADADASAALSNVVGIALHGAANGQPLEIVTEDPLFTPGATLSNSITGFNGCYVLSDTAGGIKPFGDIDADDYCVVLFVYLSATTAYMKIIRSTSTMAA